ncbi:MAG: diguanylate cyclase [Rhodospirillales bacterium]|jgi:diguanylate cyclase (GGDEF)-like protein
MKRSTKIIAIITLAILTTEAGLVLTSWLSARRVMEQTIQDRGATLREGFAIAQSTTEMQLGAIANFIADVEDVRRFMALAQVLGDAPPATMDDYRSQLEHIIGARWSNLQFRFLLRQLAFHLPDGTTFLRVERPYQHGERTTPEHGLVDASIASRRVRSGFEIGAWSTGLRATAPITVQDADGATALLGVVEVGTSFDPMLVPICPTAECGVSVLLSPLAGAAMAPASRDALFTPDRITERGWLMEASSNPAITRAVIDALPQPARGQSDTRLLRSPAGRWLGVTTFPLLDFPAQADAARPPIGMVAVWQDATDLIDGLHADLRTTMAGALLAFILVETVLIAGVHLTTRRLEREIAGATAESRALLRKVTELAERDPLTDLYNRRSFSRRMSEETARQQREERPLSLAIIDLDHFKRINDTHGHAAGDEVILRLVGHLSHVLRGSDLCGRWGGEEFLIAFPAATVLEAGRVLERLRECIANDRGPLAFSFSAGVTQWRDGDDFDTMLHRADESLYRAKREGRDRIAYDRTPESVA